MAVEILNRREFKKYWRIIFRKRITDDHPLWEAEKFQREQLICKAFICVRPINMKRKDEYWAWVRENLKGQITCYSSSDERQEEWWGFTNKSDIFIWMLKWAR